MVRSEKTRRYIIEKTAPIFNKKGYVGTYLSDMTEATGLTKGSIYGNFKDKNEVALEAFRYNYELQTKQILEDVEKETRACDKLLVFLGHYKTVYKTIFKNGGCAILNTAVDADNGNEFLRKEVVKKINNWSNMIVSILQQGMEEGEIKPLDASEYAYKMIAMVEGSILLSKTLNKPDILLKNLELLEEDILKLRSV
ncbi:MAG: TetR/AcrR family transcriptional regulator [Flavobacteriales bacterium]|nr:TetR/AcrR family transcriptional regulator [Flavobacteriales bacterium]MCB9447386.1 TetR/AcrR family transcriptional regulator [Flavobacteriales bacterium]